MNFSKNENVDTIRSHFLIPEGIPWVIYNPDDAGSAKEIVLSITPIPEEEEAEEDKNDAAAEEKTEKDNYSDIALEETEDNTEKVEGEREE
jgi:hypothetical protein